MKKTVISSRGMEMRVLSAQEVADLAELGDEEARIEVFKNRIRTATTDSEKLNLVIAFLTRDAHAR